VAAQLKDAGAPEDVVAGYLDRDASAGEAFGVFEENAAAVEAFLDVDSFWQFDMMGMPVAFDLEAADTYWRRAGTDLSAEVFELVMVMARAGLKEMQTILRRTSDMKGRG